MSSAIAAIIVIAVAVTVIAIINAQDGGDDE